MTRLGLILILLVFLTHTLPVYADIATGYVNPGTMPAITQHQTKDNIESPSSSIRIRKTPDCGEFTDWVNERVCRVETDTDYDRGRVREEWERAIGVDIFYPYFKVREFKIKTENKTKVKFFRLHGKAKLEKDEAKFIFRMRF